MKPATLVALLAVLAAIAATSPVAQGSSRRLADVPAVFDAGTAIRLADRVFPGSRSWLDACARSEGGLGRWKWNGGVQLDRATVRRYHAYELRGWSTLRYRPLGSSGAGGPWQFLRGTFYANVDAAFAEARAHGWRVERGARSWYSATGQAMTAAYMLRRGWSSQWYGAGC